MSKPDILSGSQRLYIVIRRLVMKKAEVIDYRLGKDGDPLIVVSENPLRRIDLTSYTGKPKGDIPEVFNEGGFNCIRYFGTSIVWKD